MSDYIINDIPLCREERDLDAPGALHQLWFRGIEQGNIVCDDTDRKMFVDCMDLLVKGSDTEISAFALLPVTGRLRLLDKDIEEGIASAGITLFFLLSGSRLGKLPC
ncbi:MAG: hypothetical protein FDX30_04895 [Chlorobium sp.]|nr:MAG: hypothetical protein FDX30_04895 [Chlorobium sp.]